MTMIKASAEKEIQKYMESGWQIVNQGDMAVAYSEHGSCVVISSDGKTRHYETVPGKYQKLIAVWNTPIKAEYNGKKRIFRKVHWEAEYDETFLSIGSVKHLGKFWSLCTDGKRFYAFSEKEISDSIKAA